MIGAALDVLRPRELAAGAALGTDSVAAAWARSRGLRPVEYPVTRREYDTLGPKRAPIARNRRMLVSFQPDFLLAFPGSNGTRRTIAIAKELGIPVYLVDPTTRRISRAP